MSARRASALVAVLLFAVAVPAGALAAQAFASPGAVPLQVSPSAEPSGSAVPSPSSTRPQPTERPEPSPSVSPSPAPRRTADPASSPTRTRPSPSASPSAPAFATFLPAPSPGPLETSSVTSPQPVFSAPVEPPEASSVPVPAATSGSATGAGLERLVRVALGIAVLLGVAGVTGLYLTRE